MLRLERATSGSLGLGHQLSHDADNVAARPDMVCGGLQKGHCGAWESAQARWAAPHLMDLPSCCLCYQREVGAEGWHNLPRACNQRFYHSGAKNTPVLPWLVWLSGLNASL